MTLEVFGFDAFDRAMGSLADDVDRASRESIVKAGGVLRSAVKRNASTGRHDKRSGHITGTGPGPNVITGNLKRTVKSRRPTKKHGVWSARTGVTARYAGAVEREYPFFKPAFESTKSEMGRIMTEAWARVLRRYSR